MQRSTIWILSAVLSTVCICSVVGWVGAFRPDPDPDPPATALALTLKVKTPRIRVGESPKISAELTNKGPVPVTVVLPGDGSESGWRTPVITWDPRMKIGGRCGNINPLKKEEVVSLAPGKSLSVSGWIGAPTLGGVGKHKVRVTMENKPGMTWKGLSLGAHDPEAMRRVRASAPFKVVSNVVEVEVVPAKPE